MTDPPDEEQPQPILVLSRKKPHLILFMIIVILSGLVVFVDPPEQTDVPDWLAKAWAGLLLATGSISLLAHIQRLDRERGMYVERGMLTIQSAAVVCYAAALPTWIPWDGGLVISMVAATAWAGFNMWEVFLIGKDLQLIAAARSLGARSSDAADE